MGNQESKPAHGHSASASTSSNHHHHHQHTLSGSGLPQQHERSKTVPRRRESVHTVKASASPSASLTSATAYTTKSKDAAKDSLKRAANPAPHSTPQPPSTGANTYPTPPRSINASQEAMGPSSSKQDPKDKPVSAPQSLPHQPTPLSSDPAASSSPPPKPIDVPNPNASAAHAATTQQETSENYSPALPNAPGFVDASYQLATPSQFSRPPRLPLPIEREVHAPGSPIISPADINAPIGPIEGDVVLPRRTSVLSSTTVDDEDLGDDVNTLEAWNGAPTVPTLLEWREDGKQVYVTGTFAGWDKKFRLHRNGPSKHKGALSALINLVPGTHHVRFIVDNDMKLSKYMPTAVDYTNFLVNYIEVAPPPPPAEPISEAEAAKHPPPTTATPPPQVRQTEPPTTAGVHPPQTLPAQAPTSATPSRAKSDATSKPRPKDGGDANTSSETLGSTVDKPKMAPLASGPPKKYHTQIPQFFLDMEADEDPSVYPRAMNVARTLPEPPSLPMFLGKSVLNGATPMKDDASVLVMPNHTVLNHLATSSIKNRVLATSATTRYKRKFLTTIMYKPTTPAKD